MKELTNSVARLSSLKSESDINIEYLEAVAGVRFCLMEVAYLLHSNCSGKKNPESMNHRQQLLISQVKEMCQDHGISTDYASVGPSLYLVKLLVRQYGFPCLNQVCEAHPWMVPEELRTADQAVSLFVIIY